MSRILICADDYAQNPFINSGILQLAKMNRINAISCLVNSALWPQASVELNQLQPSMTIGLHFNLTMGEALSSEWQQSEGPLFSNLPQLLQKIYSRKLAVRCVAAELLAQLECYKSCMQSYPLYIDGHQHVHQLPIVRDAFVAVYKKLKLSAMVRNTSNGWRDFLSMESFPKQQLIALLGGYSFKQRLVQASISFNPTFSGIYNFKQAVNYRSYFRHFLKNSVEGGLIMCHPGEASNDPTDPLYGSRHHELKYFLSDAFLCDLEDNSFQIKAQIG